MRSFLFLLLAICATATTTLELESDDCCTTASDCPVQTCHNATCLIGIGCDYTRLPVEECCLTNEECCPYASANEEALCIADECSFRRAIAPQCTTDAHCLALREGYNCRSTGTCHEAVCTSGWCQCVDTSASDYDSDGALCPDDCNNADPAIQATIKCYRDEDNDGFPNCNSCYELCVPTGTTCPEGYVNSDYGDLPRATSFQLLTECDDDLGFTDTSSLTSSDSSSSSWYNNQEVCDCCDLDPLAYPGSTYASLSKTKCNTYDYNCDGDEITYACCVDGTPSMEILGQSPTPVERIVWDRQICELNGLFRDTVQCGGCTSDGDEYLRYAGVDCEESCPSDELLRKRSVGLGPATCNGESRCVSESSVLRVGDCVSYVSHCVPLGNVYADGTEVCQLTAN